MAAAGGDTTMLHAVLAKTSSASRAAYNLLLSRYPPSLSRPLLSRLTPASSLASLSTSSDSSLLPVLRSKLRNSPSLLADSSLSSLLRSMPPSVAPHVHALALKLALSSSPVSASCLITLYSRSRSPDAARQLFDEIPVAHRDTVCYSSTIICLAQNGRLERSLSVFVDMRSNGVASNAHALSGALRAAAGLAFLEQARGIHAHAVVTGLDGDAAVATALLDSYGKAGVVDDAQKVFEGLGSHRNLITWNVVLNAHAHQGDLYTVRRLFREMNELGVAPDGRTFLALLRACSNLGAEADAKSWLIAMQSRYKVKPGLEHYTCVVGAMVRAGHLEDAHRFACTMPCKPDAAVWRTLLTGCAVHRNADMAEVIGKRLLEIDPNDGSSYSMISFVYSALGRKYSVMRSKRRLRAECARSWIEVRGQLHVFVADKKGNEHLLDDKLNELMREAEKIGCKEEDKRNCYRSERLALAYGLIHGAVPPGKMMRIVHNSRICAQSHEFFKYASKLIDRVIVVRDVKRYHTIKQGICSCRDYW